ncbi:MAG: PAS domain S-box protein [Smithellaceae bacterium]|jgi:diguanylate cyclase (GGDEF)-like protein/PAS domain S-box-containing protein
MSVTAAKKKPSKQIDLFDLAKNIISNIGVGIYIVQRGKFVYISPLYSKFTGYSDPELLDKNSLDRVHPDDKAMVREKAVKSLKGKYPESYEYRYIRKNGDTMWILEMITSITYKGHRATLGSFMDITERKRIEETLLRSEEKYRSILESIREGYFELDLDGNYTFANEANCRYLGYTKEELIGMNYRRHMDEETAKKLYKPYLELYRTGKPIDALELESIRKDGTKAIHETSVSLIRNSKGNPVGFRGVSRDVTERKNMEEALRQSVEKYRNILENMQEGYFEIDLTGTFTFVNDAECRNIGYSREELIGMNHRQFQDEKTAKNMRRIFTNVYLTSQPVKLLDIEIIRKNGTKGFNEISISLIRDNEGTPIGFRGISRDVTERRQMEETIRQSEEKYRTIIDEMDEWYFEIDLTGNIVFINDAVARSVGYSLKQLIGINYRSFIKKDQAGELYKIFRQVYETGEPTKSFPYEFIRPDGTITLFELSIFPKLDGEGKVFGFRGIGHDITERKRTEQQLNYIATHDPLTGLPNRILFMDRLKMALAQAKRNGQKLAAMMLDLDHFKNVNDTLGHMVGDQLLKEISLRLTGRLRQNDTISRLGGDEFIILLPAIERVEDSIEVAEIILSSFQQPFTCDDNKITSSVSIGIAIYPDDCEDIDSLLKNADMAMYYVKAHGRNGYHFFANIKSYQSN